MTTTPHDPDRCASPRTSRLATSAVASEQLTALWRRQRARRPHTALSGTFGPPGWLLDAELAGPLAGHVERLPAFHGDTLQTRPLPAAVCAALLARVPASALDEDRGCGPTTRTLARAGLTSRELRPFGYVVGPDRVDERVALDGVRVSVGEGSPITHEGVVALLTRYCEDDSSAGAHHPERPSGPRSGHRFGHRSRPGSARIGSRRSPLDPELLALTLAVAEVRHLTLALAPVWPDVREAFGLGSVRHPPDEISLMSPLRPTGDSFRARGADPFGSPAIGGVRLWWRFGASRHGCPTRGGMRRPVSIDELTRRLEGPAPRASPGT